VGACEFKGRGGAEARPTRRGLRLAERGVSGATLHGGWSYPACEWSYPAY